MADNLMNTLSTLQKEVFAWASRQGFKGRGQSVHQPLLGLTEEVGELAEAIVLGKQESWLPVPGYEEFYAVSDRGRVRRIKSAKGTKPNKILKLRPHKQGYMTVVLYAGAKETRQEIYVHILVTAAFIGQCPEGYEVNHRNGIQWDNDVRNLEYTTPGHNQQHAIRIGLRRPKCGEDHPMVKLTNTQVTEIRNATGTHREIAEHHGVSKSTVGLIRRGKIWTKSTGIGVGHIDVGSTLDMIIKSTGSLDHAHLKGEQGIRHSPEEILKMKADAVGDIVIYLADYCAQNGLDLGECVQTTWDQVKQREWTKNRETGNV